MTWRATSHRGKNKTTVSGHRDVDPSGVAAPLVNLSVSFAKRGCQAVVYVLFLCTFFRGQPNLNSCQELQVGRYQTIAQCQAAIPALIAHNLAIGRPMDADDFYHRYVCDRPGADPLKAQ